MTDDADDPEGPTAEYPPEGRPDRDGGRLTDLEFQALLDLAMVSDPWPLPGEHESVVKTLLLKESHARGYDGWVEAYHELGRTVEDGDSE